MLRPFTPTRSLLVLAFVSAFLLFSLVPRYDLLDSEHADGVVAPRAIPLIDQPPASPTPSAANSAAQSGTAAPADTTAPANTQPSQPAASSNGNSQPSASNQPSQAPSPTPTATPTQASSAPPPSASNTPAQQSTPPPNAPPATSASVTTDAGGQVQTVVVTVAPSDTSASASSTATNGADGSNVDTTPKGISTSTIIGLSVAGGIALIAIVAFVIWKFSRKRHSDDFDDNEAIKWPELNTHGENPHALPTTRTGGAGFGDTSSEVNLTRPDSRAGSLAPSASASAVDLYAANPAQDPYAVPPLPHLNPNQPYRDDPGAAYYDPYSGPVPQTFVGDPHEVPGGEAIPMTQIGRSRSPGPAAGFDMYDAAAGRQSPGPQAAFGYPVQDGRNSPAIRARSPGPAAAYGGRASPGPQAAYGGRASPGPQAAYGPGPGYGGRPPYGS